MNTLYAIITLAAMGVTLKYCMDMLLPHSTEFERRWTPYLI